MTIAPEQLVPFRWPSGWTDPALLRLLEGGPLNCLLIPGSTGVAAAAGKMGMAVDERAPAAVGVISGLVWPSARVSSRGRGGEAEAGPTGAPWIDSNCSAVRLARAREPRKTLWLDFAPPQGDTAPDLAALEIAVADSAAAGARWIVRLHDGFARLLASGDADAVRTWRGMLATLTFFEKHREWASWEPWGALGVLSGFAGDNEFMGKEVLNLAARRNLLYRVLDRTAGPRQSLDRLKAVLYLDDERPSPEWKARLDDFGRRGGLIIVPRALASTFSGGKPVSCPVPGYELRAFGNGSLALATRAWEDPYFLAADAHSLVGRRHDPVRLFNGALLWEHYATAPGGGKELLQLVSFSARRNESVSVGAAHPFRSAVLHVPGAGAPVSLEPERVDGRQEFHLPAFSRYAAVEFGL